MRTFSHQFMKDNCGCYNHLRLMSCSFMKAEPVNLSDIIASEIPIQHKYWFVCRVLAPRELNQSIAIRVAEITLPLYERKYPGNKAPREAIQAAKDFIAGRIAIDFLRKKRAAAAYAAAAAAVKQQLVDYLVEVCQQL